MPRPVLPRLVAWVGAQAGFATVLAAWVGAQAGFATVLAQPSIRRSMNK